MEVSIGQACALHHHGLHSIGQIWSHAIVNGKGAWEIFFFFFFKILFIYFVERGEGKEKERERNINVQDIRGSVASCTLPTLLTGDLAQTQA